MGVDCSSGEVEVPIYYDGLYYYAANGNDLSRNNCVVDGEKVSQPTIINLFPDPFESR